MDIPFGGAVAEAAYEHVRGVLDPAVLNHSVRVWLLADHVGRREGVRGREREALAVACLFHDAGTARAYDGPQRFEVEGADAAVAFLHGHGCHALLVRRVWEAVALHTSPGIAERMGTLPRLVRLGVLADFGAEDVLGPGDAEELAPLLSGLPEGTSRSCSPTRWWSRPCGARRRRLRRPGPGDSSRPTCPTRGARDPIRPSDARRRTAPACPDPGGMRAAAAPAGASAPSSPLSLAYASASEPRGHGAAMVEAVRRLAAEP